ncbi:MAG TPA: SIMPL domain-containing protein [Solirubrobacteraceae bacterium]|nr:SIMPL domain-containing protein [Solirubrobacteraceae bacterium]
MTDDHVSVAGAATRAVAPGAASWRAEAVEADDDPRAAYERCTTRLNVLVERLGAVGEVATEAVVVQPRFQEGRTAGAEAVGAVRVRSPAARSGDVAQAAMAAGADRLHGPRFEYDDERATRGELLGEAVDDARRKAERLAAAAGRRLGAVRAIEETSPDLVPMAEPVALRVAGAPDITPRDLTVTATVKVVFALEG